MNNNLDSLLFKILFLLVQKLSLSIKDSTISKLTSFDMQERGLFPV